MGDRSNPLPSDKPAGWARALRGGRACMEWQSCVCTVAATVTGFVFLTVALTLNRVPSVGWCIRYEYGLLLLLLSPVQCMSRLANGRMQPVLYGAAARTQIPAPILSQQQQHIRSS